jgi:hypothetical protein
LSLARDLAREVLDVDPLLEKLHNQLLLQQLNKLNTGHQVGWFMIS